jgi:hypothetical protein
VLNWDGVLKLGDMSEGDYATHFWNWIERPIAWSSIWKCSYAEDTMEEGPMMWMSSTMDGNKHEGKWLAIKRNALRWIKENNAPPKGLL